MEVYSEILPFNNCWVNNSVCETINSLFSDLLLKYVKTVADKIKMKIKIAGKISIFLRVERLFNKMNPFFNLMISNIINKKQKISLNNNFNQD